MTIPHHHRSPPSLTTIPCCHPLHLSLPAAVPASRREAEYFSERKLSLVNGMHTVLAFMTLDKQWRGNDGGKEYVLLKYERMHRSNQRVCEAWRTARVAALLHEFGASNLILIDSD
jgi:hypothetical protein